MFDQKMTQSTADSAETLEIDEVLFQLQIIHIALAFFPFRSEGVIVYGTS